MNKSVCKNCIPKCIVVSLEKNPKKVDFFKPDYQNTPLITRDQTSTPTFQRKSNTVFAFSLAKRKSCEKFTRRIELSGI